MPKNSIKKTNQLTRKKIISKKEIKVFFLKKTKKS